MLNKNDLLEILKLEAPAIIVSVVLIVIFVNNV
jgi:hypothetical protein